MPKQLFGTDGMRGVPGEFPLDDATLHELGCALGEWLAPQAPNRQVLIGIDTRESGPHIAARIAAGLGVTGAVPVYAGVITTPGVACLTRERKFSAGVVISASHNPFQDNGVKLISSSGMKFPDEVEERLEDDLCRHRESSRARLAGATGLPKSKIADGFAGPELDAELGEEYLEILRKRRIPGARLAGMRLVLDCANGAASRLAPELFRSLGADVVGIHNQPDGRNINAGCGSLHPESLREKVLETGAALGVAFDGDADRAIFVSASGRLVDGDGVLLVAARYWKSIGRLKGETIVGTTMSNLGLERALAAEGLRLARVPVGDRYVLEEMLRRGANLGGEQSGHVIFLNDATTGDGLLTALKIACLVSLQGPLDDLVRGLKRFPQIIVNVVVRSKPPLESLPELAAVLKEANRALGDSGRIVLRYSGTEPLARVMVEAEYEADVQRWSKALATAIGSSIGA